MTAPEGCPDLDLPDSVAVPDLPDLPGSPDGQFGSQTQSAVAGADQQALLAALRENIAGYYRVRVASGGSSNKFLQGWLRRAYT